MLSVRVLGEVRAEVDGHPAELGGPRQRAVLALLVAAGGRVVSTDRFVEDLWSGEPPPKALGALQAYVSHLRRALEPARRPRQPATVLVSATPGYRLDLPTEAVDAWWVVDLAERAAAAERAGDDPQRVAALVAEARVAWGGEPFAAYRDRAWAGPAVDRLLGVRARLVELGARATLAAGRPADVLADLEGLVRDEPLRESAVVLLALARYRAGRQGDALAALRAARGRLVAELGVEPGAELRALEADILAHRVTGPVTTVPAPAQPSIPDTRDDDAAGLLGREPERRRLAAAVAEVGSAAGVAWVEGDAGVGKSALLECAGLDAAAGGAVVVRGRCAEAGGAPPGWPWREVLASLPSGPHPGGTDETASPFALASRVLAALSPLGEVPVVVVLEDLHRADGETLQVLRHVPSSARSPLLLLGSFRGDEVGADLAATLALVLDRTVERLVLGGLDDAAARTLLRRTVARELPETVWRGLVARAAGNALFLRQLGRLVASEGPEVAARGVPAGVRELLDRRIERLPAPTVAMLTRAAVLGRDLDVDVLLGVDALRRDLAPDAVLDELDAGVVAGLLVAGDDGPALRFAHALVHEVFLARIPPMRRTRLHAAVLEHLERERPDRVDALAHHAAACLGPSTAARVLPHLEGGARRARAAGALDDAVTWWRAAVRAHGLAGGVAGRLAARHELVGAVAAGGDVVAARAERADAVADAERACAQGLVGRDVVARAWVWDTPALWSVRPVLEDADAPLARLQELLDETGDPTDGADLRVDLLLTLVAESEPWRLDLALPALREALARTADPHDAASARRRCLALAAEHRHAFALERPDAGARAGAEMLRVAERFDLADYRALAHLVLVADAVGRGDLDRADAHHRAANALATSGQLPGLLLSTLLFEATNELVRGDPGRAGARLDELTARLEASGDPNGPFVRAWARGTAAAVAGDVSGLLDELEDLATRLPGGVDELLLVARLDAGRPAGRELGSDRPRDGTWLLATALRCVAACRVGDTVVAGRAAAAIRPWSGQLVRVVNGHLVLGPVDAVLARVADLRGDVADAERLRTRALALADRVGSTAWRTAIVASRPQAFPNHEA